MSVANPELGDLEQQLAAARSERDAALERLARRDRRAAVGGSWRRAFVVLLVLLVSVLAPVTATAAWARHTVLNTNGYVSTVAPLASDPAVTSAVARIATDQLFTALDPQPRIEQALPARAAFLAGPITNGVEGFVRSQADNLLQTPAFARLWTTANRVAHAQLVSVLKGNSDAVRTTNGTVVLDLVPVLNDVLRSVQQQASALLGRDITLPQLTGDELPSAACAKLATALDRPLPKTCGQIPLFPADKLSQAQRAVRVFDASLIALLIAVPLLALAALYLSRRRRRTLLQMAFGVMFGMVVLRRTVMWLQNSLINTGRPANEDARRAIVDQLLHGFFTVSLWVLWIAFAVFVVAAVTGPYAWATASRARVAGAAHAVVRWTRVAAGQAHGAAGSGWIPAHLDALRVGGAVLALLLVLAFNLPLAGVLVVLVLAAGYEFWLYRIGVATRQSSAPGAGPRV